MKLMKSVSPLAIAVGLAFGAGACHQGGTPTHPSKTTSATVVGSTQDRRAERTLSDAEIARAALAHMQRDPAMRGAVIRAHSTNGIVELTGTTKNLLAKERAAQHAEALRGVRSVSNRLVVERTSVADDVLARNVESALRQQFPAATEHVLVQARDGVVVLGGRTPSIAAKHLASSAAEGVAGVTEVRDMIDVVPTERRSDAEIASEVRARLNWDVFVDDALVQVASANGTLRLSGVLGSAVEKTRAIEDARVGGVTRIDTSGLRVEPWADRNELRREKYADRPKEAVEAAINFTLARDPRVRLTNVAATVADRIVTLRGTVESLKAKRAAEQIAHDTVGVAAVANLLEVKSPSSPRTPAYIERDVEFALDLDPYTKGTAIDARIEGGTAILEGTVESVFDKAEAESAAAGVPGVRAIDNRLEVRNPSRVFVTSPFLVQYGRTAAVAMTPVPKADKSDTAIATDLALEIGWSPFLDARAITARVHDGRAVLTGTVPTWQAWYAASTAALDAGAINVDNRLTVRPDGASPHGSRTPSPSASPSRDSRARPEGPRDPWDAPPIAPSR